MANNKSLDQRVAALENGNAPLLSRELMVFSIGSEPGEPEDKHYLGARIDGEDGTEFLKPTDGETSQEFETRIKHIYGPIRDLKTISIPPRGVQT